MSDFIQEAIAQGIIGFDADKKNIIYTHQNKKRSYQNPEEHVQAETFCKLVLHYGYSPKQILQFVSVKMGVTDKEADMVVYTDETLQQPYIIVECKKEDISELEFKEAVKQAFSYAHALAGTTKFVWVTKGNKEEFYKFDKDKDKKITIADIPFFGETDIKKYKYAKGGYYTDKVKGKLESIKVEDIKPIQENELTRIFKQSHDALWDGGKLNPSQAFDELDKLIFCKIWDEKNTKKGEAYKFQIFADEAEQEQANLEALQKRIQELYDNGKTKDPEIFNKPIDLAPEKIKTVVEYFQGVHLSKTDLDSKGKAFETFLGSYFRGEFGQYFTPRNVVKFAVEVLPITHESKVLDTSCGSGGFLLYCLDKVRRQAEQEFDANDPEEAVQLHNQWHDFAEKRLFGIEINDQISRTAKMNMIIHDDGHTNVVTHDGLFEADYIATATGNKGFKNNSFDFVVTNPPFGSIAKQSEKAYMQITASTAPAYTFALKEANWIDKQLKPKHATAGRENQSTEILFIEQCYKFLKEGGYVAIVLPDGVLTNSSLQYIRNGIEDLFRIVAVVSLPQTAFTHTGAGVKSSVLFLKKWTFAKTQEIKAQKEALQTHIATTRGLRAQAEAWENTKKELQKQLKKTTKAKDDASLFEQAEDQTEKIQQDIERINEKIESFKEELEETYQTEKALLMDYPIFMAIADNIGYDATGKDSFKVLSKEENYTYKNKPYTREVQENDLFALEVLKTWESVEGKMQLVTKRQTIVPNTGITGELKNFIQAIENGKDSFFA